ncbi:MAG TPA: hypothetical protein VG815_00875, partial [Chloroflexota bacterium]|nr:hypothetical protein [Chloroflexota bacterium]
AGGGRRPVDILAAVAPEVVPALYKLAERTWPRQRETTRRKFGFIGPEETVREDMPVRYKVLMRRYDLATLRPSWRLEAGGPVELFEWDDSGKITGRYGFRYPVYSICPVFDESGHWSGFGLSGRPPSRDDGALNAIDARLECLAYVRSTNVSELLEALKAQEGKPRIEEARPGMAPTEEFTNVLQHDNKRTYLTNRGVNEYLGPGWTPDTIRLAFRNPRVRAVWIADPKGPNATPTPQEH